ncbi:MAG TPA: DNA polymerase IV [Bdellovibrionota bacterium]|jgi:DNA polymerase-4|nr:DNA polymerase IV [Bdellovibrionota bacterium]
MSSPSTRKIIHVDMDCFYAAVEIKHQPELAGLPLGIGGPPNTRSVLCTASYEARKFGVRSAMSSAQAVKLCPDLVILPPNFPLYRKESQAVREIFGRFTEKVEPLSLDEAYLDVSHCENFGGSATLIAQEIRRLIRTELNLSASAGVAPNKFLAKIASDWRKPNGLFVVTPEQVPAFVEQLPVEKLHGVGRVTAEKLHKLELRTCADLKKCTVSKLTEWFGSRGEYLHELAHGRDEREVESEWQRKSLSVEETYERDLSTFDECAAQIPSLFAEWKKRIQNRGYERLIKGFVVKLKFFDFQSTTHEMSARRMPEESDFRDLLKRAWERRAAPVRLVGVGVRLDGDDSTQLPQQLTFEFYR